MGYGGQVWYLLLGVVLYALIRQIAKVIKINIPSGTIQFVAYTGGLLFIAANLSISLSIVLITTGGNAMTPDDLHTIATWAYAFGALAFVLAGALIAALITFILSAFRNRAKSQSSSPDAIDKTGEQTVNKPKSEFTPRANIAFAILEVIFLAIALSLLSSRLVVVYSNTPGGSWDNFPLYLWRDMTGDWRIIYVIVAVIFLLWAVAKGWRINDSDKKEKWQFGILMATARKLGVTDSEIESATPKRLTVAKKRKQNTKVRKIK
jgi:vacuolar-type H+-ATPase subunit I/STV1